MEFDAIIVGGGIIGCSSAYHLALKGLKVAIIEQAKLASGTSSNNFSWANATSKISDKAYHMLNAKGVALYDELATQFGAERLGINPAGAIEFADKSLPTDYKSKQAKVKQLAKFGYPCRWLDPQEIPVMEPHLSFGKTAEAFYTETDKIVNAPKFARFLAEQVTQMGGQIFENCTALQILADDNGAVLGLITDKGEMGAKNVVIATGPNTPEVLANLTGFDGFNRFPVNKVPGFLLTTPPLTPNTLRHLIHSDASTEVHFLPDFNGGVRIGSDDVDGQIIDNQSTENLKRQGLELLRRATIWLPVLNTISVDDCKLAIGIRAYPEDGKTIAGPLPGAKGLFVIATHSGITLAPVIGYLMAEVVTKGTIPEMLKPFLLDRLEGFS